MIRLLVIVGIAVAAFVAAIAVPLAMSGNLSAEGINQILGRDDASTASVASEEDPLGPFAQKLREREVRLNERERAQEERDTRLDQRERELDETLEQLRQMQDLIAGEMAEEDAAREERLAKLAKMVAAMDPRQAAADLETMSPEDAAEVLLLMKDRTAGSILDEMEQRKRVMVHQILQSRRY